MKYNITLDLMTYIIVLIVFGAVGSCFQSHKENGTTRPFFDRIICGSFAGSVTLLVVYVLRLGVVPPGIHFGIAALLGLISEKGESSRIIDLVFNRGRKS